MEWLGTPASPAAPSGCAAPAAAEGHAMWAVDGLANFLPYAGLPLLLAGPVTLLARRRAATLAAMLLVAAGVAIIAAPGAFLALAHEPEPDAPRLRVVTANVLMNNERLSSLADDVLAQEPDVIVFEELQHDLAEVSPRLAAAYPHRLSTDIPWLTVASRLPLADARQIALAGSDRGRDLLAATIEVAGQRVALVAVHIMPPLNGDAFRLTREQHEALEAEARRAAGPLLVVGDLNATALSPTFAGLLRSTGLRIATGSRWPRPTYFAYGRFGVRIDHVLVRDLAVASERVFALDGSDHRGLSVDVALRGLPSTAAARR
jgi:endonuclease/exonuclease/phosphatase (EEP) superfamily protein YafD